LLYSDLVSSCEVQRYRRRTDLVVASDYALPESTLNLLAGLVVKLAAKGANTEAA
jgi:hypothetical protein